MVESVSKSTVEATEPRIRLITHANLQAAIAILISAFDVQGNDLPQL